MGIIALWAPTTKHLETGMRKRMFRSGTTIWPSTYVVDQDTGTNRIWIRDTDDSAEIKHIVSYKTRQRKNEAEGYIIALPRPIKSFYL